MKKKRTKVPCTFWFLILGFLAVGAEIRIPPLPAASAEEAPLQEEEAVLKKIQELEALRSSDPEAYQARVREKKERLGEKFRNFREKDPEKFQAFLEKHRGFRRRHLEHFRTRHPEAFERFRARKREHLNQWRGHHDRRRRAR